MTRRQRKSGKKNRPRHNISAKQGRTAIALCMIVRNEEKYLEDCLKSVQGLVSEMIVVDTGSADRTVAIAEKFNATVIHYPWNNDFAAARNAGLQKASNPWILYLDADERLHPQFHSIIKKQIASDAADAYYLNVHSKVSGVLGNIPHVQAYPRLFRKLPGVKFIGRVHEQITPSLQAIKARFGVLPAEIEHLGYALSEAELEQKIKRNLKYLKQQVEEEPENAYALFQLGQTYILAGENTEGEIYLKQALDSGYLTPPLAASALLILANEAFKKQNYEKAMPWIRQSIEYAPRQRLGWFLLSECLAKQEKWSEALQALNNLSKYQNLVFTDLSLDKIFDKYLIAQRLGLYHFYSGEYRKSISFFCEYFQSAPEYRTSVLEKLLYSLNQVSAPFPENSATFSHIIQNIGKFDNQKIAIRLLAAYCEANKNYSLQERIFQWACEVFPDQSVYYFYLGNAILNQNRFFEAEEQFLKALEIDRQVYEIYYNLAVVAIKQANFPKAIKFFGEIRQMFPEHASMANRKIAALYLKMGKPELALQMAASGPGQNLR